MIQRHCNKSSNELEVQEMIRIYVRSRINLQTVIVLVRILEETVHGVQDFVRQQEEPFAGNTAVIKALLTLEDDVEATAQLVSGQTHHIVIGVFEEGLAGYGYFDMAGERVALTQVPVEKERNVLLIFS